MASDPTACRTEFLPAPDGTELFVRRWYGTSCTDRLLAIVHGAGEHGGRYEHFAEHFAAQGWNVLAADARGHGRSAGIPTHVRSFQLYVDDLAEVLRRSGTAPERIAVFAHSMGGLVASRLLQTSPRREAGAIVLSSPLLRLQVRIPALKRAIGRICSWLAPEVRFTTNVRGDQLTRSEWAQRRRAEDPHSQSTVTAGWYFQVLDAICDAWDDAPRLSIPALVQQGEDDEVVDPRAALAWWCRVGAHDKLLRLLKGHLHELAAEPTWTQTADFLLEWLNPRIPMRPHEATAALPRPDRHPSPSETGLPEKPEESPDVRQTIHNFHLT